MLRVVAILATLLAQPAEASDPTLAPQSGASAMQSSGSASIAMASGLEPGVPRVVPQALIENAGQWPDRVLFATRRAGTTIWVEQDALRLAYSFAAADGKVMGQAVGLRFEGASPTSQVENGGIRPGAYNFILGNDAERWVSGARGYESVHLNGVRPGVDVVVRQTEGVLIQYDLLLAPRADLGSLVIRAEGVDGLRIDDDGDLVLVTSVGEVRQAAPRSWELAVDGTRRAIASRFRLLPGGRFGFEVPARDLQLPLVIDPGLTWATLLGGTTSELCRGLAVATNGDVVIGGRSNSWDFPTTPGAYDQSFEGPVEGGGPHDGFVTRLAPDGSALVYSTWFGGSDWEQVNSAAMAPDGSVALTGLTESLDMPTSPGAFQATYQGGTNDVFVAVIDPTGSSLVLGTYLGTSVSDQGRDVLPGDAGQWYVCGRTNSLAFPTTPGAFIQSLSGPAVGPKGFIALLDPAQSGAAQLVASTYLSGTTTGGGQVYDLCWYPDGRLVATGLDQTSDFPFIPGTYSAPVGSGYYVMLSPDLAGLDVAGQLHDPPFSVAVTPEGGLLFSTTVVSPEELLITPGAFDTTHNGNLDTVVYALDPTLTTLAWGTYIGGGNPDSSAFLATDPDGNVLLATATKSSDYPVTPGAHDTTWSGGFGDPWVGKLSADGSTLLYGSFLGGSTGAVSGCDAIVSDGMGGAYVAGSTVDANFPVSPGAFQTDLAGGAAGDLFIAHLPFTLSHADLGHALPGSAGLPNLAFSGSVRPGGITTLTLTRAKPSGVTHLVAGFSGLLLPFKGGVLVPSPDLLFPGLPVSASGTHVLSFVWPMGVPQGTGLWIQHWIPDAVGPQGFAASNGLMLVAQ